MRLWQASRQNCRIEMATGMDINALKYRVPAAGGRKAVARMVTYAAQSDLKEICQFDRLVPGLMLVKAISDSRVAVYKASNVVLGLVRWSHFWDSIPFLNILYVPDGYTHAGVGTALLEFWESEMKAQGNARVFASAMSKAQGQHFFRRRGYVDIGNIYDEDEGQLGLILQKRL
jgi:N-acetylglutamate synthase-like GNAT family acetyltransferase